MLKKSLKFAKIALLDTRNKDFLGYKQILEQEKIPFQIINNFKGKYDLLIMPLGSDLSSDILKAVYGGMKMVMTNSNDEVGYKYHGTGTIYNFTGGWDNSGFGAKFIDKVTMHSGELGISKKEDPEDITIDCSKIGKIIPQEMRIGLNKLCAGREHEKRREQRIKFKKILYSLIGPITQIWYWPDDHMSCFNQRIDVDFPLAKFHKRKIILNNLNHFLERIRIPCSLFLNYTFRHKENKQLIIPPRHDVQSHGCSTSVPHRYYCYDIDNLTKKQLKLMLQISVVNKAKIFAPPAEQANLTVLKLCEELGIEWISAGYIGRDDIPHKVVVDREYKLFNIPTVLEEFKPGFNIDTFSEELEDVLKDNSLYSVFFHPELLLKKKDQDRLYSFYKELLHLRGKYKIWITTQKEIAEWWEKRDKIKFDGKKIIVNNDIIDKVRIAYWTPNKVKLERLR